jgi:hypothetical protein
MGVGVNMLSEMFKPFVKMLLLGMVIFMLLSFNWNNTYYKNAFKVTMNDKELYVHYYEKYKRGLIPLILGTESNYESSNEVAPIVNEINYNNEIVLDISEYEVYWKDSNTRPRENVVWRFCDTYSYKKIKLHKTKLIIKRKNKILYDGEYIKDVSKYVNKSGRYYFQTYVYRNDNFYTTVTTHMSFNVIVKGDNHE